MGLSLPEGKQQMAKKEWIGMSTKGTATARHHLGQVTLQLVVLNEHLLHEQTNGSMHPGCLNQTLVLFLEHRNPSPVVLPKV